MIFETRHERIRAINMRCVRCWIGYDLLAALSIHEKLWWNQVPIGNMITHQTCDPIVIQIGVVYSFSAPWQPFECLIFSHSGFRSHRIYINIHKNCGGIVLYRRRSLPTEILFLFFGYCALLKIWKASWNYKFSSTSPPPRFSLFFSFFVFFSLFLSSSPPLSLFPSRVQFTIANNRALLAQFIRQATLFTHN